MTRQEMIQVLVEYRLSDSMFLEEVLLNGWKGYENLTDIELREFIEQVLDTNEVQILLERYSYRKNIEKKLVNEIK